MNSQDKRVKQVVRDVFNNNDKAVRDKVACWGFRKTFFGFDSVNEAQFPLDGILATVFYVPPGKLSKGADDEGDQSPRFVQGMVIAQNSPHAWDNDYHDVSDVLAQLRHDDDQVKEKERELRDCSNEPNLSPQVLSEIYQELANLQKEKMDFLKE